MVRLSVKLSLVLVLASLLFISGCSTKYVCYDGTVEKDESKCPVIEQPKVVQKQAENAANNFASAYAQALGARENVINIYREGANWQAEVLFSVVKTGDVHRIVLEIDGRSARVSCIENCGFLEINNEDVELNESVDELVNDSTDGEDSDFSVY